MQKELKFANVNIIAWIINVTIFRQTRRIVYHKQSLTQPKNKSTKKQYVPVLIPGSQLRTLLKVWSLKIKLLKDFCYV